MSVDLAGLRNVIAGALQELEHLFNEQVQLNFVARHRTCRTAHLFVGQSSLGEAREALREIEAQQGTQGQVLSTDDRAALPVALDHALETGQQSEALDAAVRAYLLAHPKLLLEARVLLPWDPDEQGEHADDGYNTCARYRLEDAYDQICNVWWSEPRGLWCWAVWPPFEDGGRLGDPLDEGVCDTRAEARQQCDKAARARGWTLIPPSRRGQLFVAVRALLEREAALEDHNLREQLGEVERTADGGFTWLPFDPQDRQLLGEVCFSLGCWQSDQGSWHGPNECRECYGQGVWSVVSGLDPADVSERECSQCNGTGRVAEANAPVGAG